MVVETLKYEFGKLSKQKDSLQNWQLGLSENVEKATVCNIATNPRLATKHVRVRMRGPELFPNLKLLSRVYNEKKCCVIFPERLSIP